MKTLQLEQAYTVLRISEGTAAQATLGEQVAPHFAQGGRLILDVGGIQFNSMLIGELVNLHRRFEEGWGSDSKRITLANLTPASRAVLERVHLGEIFDLADSLADALNGLRSTAKRSPGAD